ncbi:hypothetical protein [Streptomyces sp. NBC_00370]|uniref:hypothetical protein n=1 Tax=Streptomyces sp. NBC_00370 TaxID=2975728 RepID=UPI002E26D503
MNPHTTLQLHAVRSAELRADAAAYATYRQVVGDRQPARLIRPRLGWALVELGLRLVNNPGAASQLVRTA